jgi:pimeloyl-ACP methyl ester carboxylesterase
MTSIEHGFADVNGIRLHYAQAGKSGQLVLLLHGFPEFWYSWRKQLAALGDSFRAVAPDMRGYNLSDKPERVEEYRIDKLVADVIGLIDYFGEAKAVVVGHDWGAGVAWAVAQKYPERVSKLVVLQVPPAAAWRANMTAKQMLRSWYMFLFQLPILPERMIRSRNFRAIDETFKRVARQDAFSNEDIELYKEAIGQPGALTSAINYYRANVLDRLFSRRDGDNSRPTARVQVPTLFIFGEQDFAIVPETVRDVNKYVDAQYTEVRIPESGHWVQNEAAEKVNSLIRSFIDPTIH